MNDGIAIRVRPLSTSDSWLRHQSAKWNEDLKFLMRETRVITLLLRHPDVSWHAKLIAACTLGYLLSPIQLIPTFIPVIGQLLDDLAVLLIARKLLRALTAEAVLVDCELRAHSRKPAWINRRKDV
jgi:uncharacterized membrane protein YkvA (DUF1232 family)